MREFLSVTIGESDDGEQGCAEINVRPDIPDNDSAYFKILGNGLMYMLTYNQPFLIQIGAQALKKMEKAKTNTPQMMETLVDTPSEGRA